MTGTDYDKFDYLIAMDENNLRNMKRFVGSDEEDKVSLLLEHAGRSVILQILGTQGILM